VLDYYDLAGKLILQRREKHNLLAPFFVGYRCPLSLSPMSALFDQQNPYSQSSNYGYGNNDAGGSNANLSFYSAGPSGSQQQQGGGYDGYASGSGGRPSLEGNMSGAGGFGGSAADRSLMNSQLGFWSAFGTGGFPDEPGLMEGELAEVVCKERT
jgi:uncharacterized protein YgiB involved in biofilm formation